MMTTNMILKYFIFYDNDYHIITLLPQIYVKFMFCFISKILRILMIIAVHTILDERNCLNQS